MIHHVVHDGAASGQRTEHGPYRWTVVAMLWWVCFFNYADRQAVYSVFPLLERDLHLSPVQLGLIGSAFAWVYAIAGPVAGHLVDRMRRKTAILAGLEVWSLICAATAMSRSFGSLLVFRAAEGLGESIYFPASMSTLAAYHPGKTRSRAFGIHQTSVYVGTIAGGLIAGLIAEDYGWRAAFVLFGALGMLLGVMLLTALREPPSESAATPVKPDYRAFFRALASRPAAMLLMLGFGMMNFVAVVQLSWLPSFLYQRFSLSLSRAAFLATITAQCGAGLGALLGGWLADRRSSRPGGRITIQIAGAVGGIPFVIACGMSHSLNLTMVCLFGWGLCKGLYDANTFASLFDVLPPELRGISTGFMNSAGWLLGGTTAPVVIGVLFVWCGLGNAISLSSAGYAVAAVLLLAASGSAKNIFHAGEKFVMILKSLIAAAISLSAAAAAGEPLTVVARPQSPIESRYVTFLQAELTKRTNDSFVVQPALAVSSTDAVVLGDPEQLPVLLGNSAFALWQKKQETLGKEVGEESFSVVPITANGHTVMVLSAQGRGQLFALGWLLRRAHLSEHTVELPRTEAFRTSPEKGVRGYQIGYRMKNNTYDAWTLPQFRQQMLDMAVFGLNTMQVVAPVSDDDPTSPLFPAPAQETVVGLSRMSQEYGLRYDLFYPEMAKDYTDSRQFAAELRQFEELVRSLPLVDSIHVPGGDPGHTSPDVLLPLVEQETKILHRYHPKAEMWVSAQGFTAERYKKFYELMQTKPAYLTGIFFGPQSREAMELQRKQIPAEYPIEFYPDTAHVMHSQFPVPNLDPIYALTEGREPICPRPSGFEHIYRHFQSLTSGFIVYSEGVNDDVNKVLWGGWGWKTDASTHEILRDYARYFFASDGAETERIAGMIESLEKNWDGPLLQNSGIASTLHEIGGLHPLMSADNWRWDSLLYRARYDRYLQLKRKRELAAETGALSHLEEPEAPAARIAAARKELTTTRPETEEQSLRDGLGRLAGILYKECGLQLSVKLYGASNWERGANFDRVDTPLNDRTWIEAKLNSAQGLHGPTQLAALHQIAAWTHPTAGALYDDLGDPANEPHLVAGKGWTDDPEMYHTAINGIADETLEKGWRLSWLDYAETLYEEPLRLHYDHLEAGYAYRLRVTYAGEGYKLPMEMKANGVILQVSRTRTTNPEPREFVVPASAMKDGELTVEWNRPYGAGGGGRGGQVAEVWLLPGRRVGTPGKPATASPGVSHH